MKRIITIIAILTGSFLHAQIGNTTCAGAIQICLTQPVTYPASTDQGSAETGPDYGCLGSQNNPAWFLFRIGNPGTHTILESNSDGQDLDFILYGPFTNPTGNCNSLDVAHTAACSYSGGSTETINFSSTTSGDYYFLLITNYSNTPTNVTFNQTAGTGDFDCEFDPVCSMNLLTATPSICDTATSKYSVTGSVFTFNPPQAGTLTISNGTVSQNFNAPFNGQIDYTLNNLNSDGQNYTITATFSIDPTCTKTANYIAPESCLPCDVTVQSNAPVCIGSDLHLSATIPSNSTVLWTGPAGFSTTELSPTRLNITAGMGGNYTLTVTGDNCTTIRTINVQVTIPQKPQIVEAGNIVCEGGTLQLSVNNVANSTYHWIGPNNFTSNIREPQVVNIPVEGAGLYIVGMSTNGCYSRFDSIEVSLLPRPVLAFHGDTIQTAGGTGLLYATGSSDLTYSWNFSGDNSLLNNSFHSLDGDTLVVVWNDLTGIIQAEVIATDSNGCESSPYIVALYIQHNAGLNKVNDQSGIQVFPNPANAFLSIKNNQHESSLVRLTDASGKIITQLTIEAGEQKQLNLETYSSGIYFIHAGQKHFPVIIQH